jgi:hypothetical protein
MKSLVDKEKRRERHLKVASFACLFLFVATVCLASFSGDMARYFGLETSGTAIYPGSDDTISLGKTGNEFDNLFIDGTANIDDIAATTISGDITLENAEVISNGTDAMVSVTYNDDAAEVGELKLITTNTAGEDNNYFRQSFWFEDDGSVSTEAAYIDVSMDDETSNTFDSTVEIGVVTNDTLAAELNIDGTKVYPETDAGLDLGGSSNEFSGLYIDGTANIDVLNINESEILTASAVSLTSPTVAISATGKRLIVLNSDANQTAHTLTGGTQYQVVTILSGTGSNTMQFDDGATMILGANKTLTEGEGDTLTVLCTNAGGTIWSLVADGSGN